jgi:hypothetical protein
MHARENQISNLVHIYPTYSVAGQQASAEVYTHQLLSGFTGGLLKRLGA